MQAESHYHSLSNNQNYICREYDRYGKLVNNDPSPVKINNMFIFDISDGNCIEVLAYQRDLSVPLRTVTVSSEYCDSNLEGTFNTSNKSDRIQGNVVRIYKNEKYNAVVFSRHNRVPCIFCVPSVDFTHPLLVLGKRPAQSGYSTMTPLEDENQKILYHEKKMIELHETFNEYEEAGKRPNNVMNIIRRIIFT